MLQNKKTMASNGNGYPSPSDASDVEANEETTLLEGNGISSDTRSQETGESDRLWDEMSRPWPATFERSITLLASPRIRAADADRFTRSPKPGNTPLANRRRMVSYMIITMNLCHIFLVPSFFFLCSVMRLRTALSCPL
jgi:hypothetical protein